MYPFWKSRKFWLAVFAIVQAVVLHYLNVPQEIWEAIAAMIGVLIASIAVEDAGEKAGAAWLYSNGEETPPDGE